jgi:tetratricopeptide (TPR) repeat protein
MKRAASLVILVVFTNTHAWATCGGGGGGGVGGIAPSGAREVYNVPWRVAAPGRLVPPQGLVLYWFPLTPEEVKKSELRTSRVLSLYASQCVAMEVAPPDSALVQKFAVAEKRPAAVLASGEGAAIAEVGTGGALKVGDVENLIKAEMKQREDALERQMTKAKTKAKAGELGAAVELYKTVLDQRCLFPKRAKDAAKELKRLGTVADDDVSDLGPVLSEPTNSQIAGLMRKGLDAEVGGQYVDAGALYQRAHELDPADPTPLRYLGELYRHHTGEWDKARSVFGEILAMRADPLSRAVALHGLGKMTIHDGEFAKGLHLFEESIETYPLALTYRNLAVYWNSEGDVGKADGYVAEALRLDPEDPYNAVFAATYLVGRGRGAEALTIARKNEGLLPASYNLAAIYALMGDRDKALELLKRHFYEYERFAAVRAKEMTEARADAVFRSIQDDPAFVALTRLADTGTLR